MLDAVPDCKVEKNDVAFDFLLFSHKNYFVVLLFNKKSWVWEI